MKKFISILLTLIISIIVLSVGNTVFASDIYTKDGVSYYLDNTTNPPSAYVVGYQNDDSNTDSFPKNIVIPSSIRKASRNYIVETISYCAFESCYGLESITLPDTIKSIEDEAFYDAQNLREVIIPQNTYFRNFGSSVFNGSLVEDYFAEMSDDGEVILGQNVLYMYLGNDDLYTVPDEITIIVENCFFLSGVKEVILNNTVDYIRSSTFASCRNLKEITIPDCVYGIDSKAFSNCTNLEKIILGDKLEYIGFAAFENTAIKNLYLGENLSEIYGAFVNSNKLENFTISENNDNFIFEDDVLYRLDDEVKNDDNPLDTKCSIMHFLLSSEKENLDILNSVKYILDYAFYNNKNLKSINLSSSTLISENAFAYSNIQSINLEKVEYIFANAFRGCKNLTSVDLSSAKSIYVSCFENCTSLTEVVFGDKLNLIGPRAFFQTALKTVDIAGEDTLVDDYAFAGCKQLEKVNFNDGVYYLGEYLFVGCSSLNRVFLDESVSSFSENTFSECENVVFEVYKYSIAYLKFSEFNVENEIYNVEIIGNASFIQIIIYFFSSIFSILFGWIKF